MQQQQYFNGFKHKNKWKYMNPRQQSLLTNLSTDLNPYILDICNLFIIKNITYIPYFILLTFLLSNFFEKNTVS